MSRRAARRALGAFVAAALSTAAFSVAQPEGTTTAEPAVPDSQRVLMLSDSVGLGARHSVPDAFPADWEVNVVGQPARFVGQLETGPCFWTLTNQRCDLNYLLAAYPDWFGDHAVIAAGYNYTYWDTARFDREVDSLINRLTAAGVKHVYWVTLREIDPQYISASAWRQVQPYYWYFPEVNERLEMALYRHPNLTLVDWAANANRSGVTYDAIHLNPTGAALYASLIRNAVYSTATTVADGSTTQIFVPDANGATAASVNLTTTHPRRAGHLTVHRCDEAPPNASVHNFVRDEVVAHAAIAPLGDDGSFCVTTHSSTNLIVDVTGLFGADEGYTAITPTRWVDTREATQVEGGTTLELNVDDIPAGAAIPDEVGALALIVTPVRSAGLGHVTVSACDPGADHSNVNYTGPPTPNLVVTAPDDSGEVCFYVKTTTDLVVDVLGVFDSVPDVPHLPEEHAPLIVDVDAPQRLFDSREINGALAAGEVVTVNVGDHLTDPGASAILNLTGLLADAPGHFTAYPCLDGAGDTSNLNLGPGRVVANAVVIAPDANGEVCISTYAEAHMIVDLLGEVGDVFDGSVPVRALDTRHT